MIRKQDPILDLRTNYKKKKQQWLLAVWCVASPSCQPELFICDHQRAFSVACVAHVLVLSLVWIVWELTRGSLCLLSPLPVTGLLDEPDPYFHCPPWCSISVAAWLYIGPTSMLELGSITRVSHWVFTTIHKHREMGTTSSGVFASANGYEKETQIYWIGRHKFW